MSEIDSNDYNKIDSIFVPNGFKCTEKILYSRQEQELLRYCINIKYTLDNYILKHGMPKTFAKKYF